MKTSEECVKNVKVFQEVWVIPMPRLMMETNPTAFKITDINDDIVSQVLRWMQWCISEKKPIIYTHIETLGAREAHDGSTEYYIEVAQKYPAEAYGISDAMIATTEEEAEEIFTTWRGLAAQIVHDAFISSLFFE